MKKHSINILYKAEKKNGAAILICIIILIFCTGTLVGCATTQEHAEIPPIRSVPTKAGGILPESEQLSGDYYVSIENIIVSLYEDKQTITDKLNENGTNYNEYAFDVSYSDSAYNKYDSYYMIGESPFDTDDSQWVDASLCAYFEDGICVRLKLLNNEPHTARGIHKDDLYSQLMEQYGDSFEKRTYAAHGAYDVYRYTYNDCICEFHVLADYPDYVQGVDIYIPSLYPIYDYGEELTE